MTRPVTYVCEMCGGTNVETHALVAWNVADQEWYIVNVKELGQIAGFPDDYCHDCALSNSPETSMNRRDASLKEIALATIEKEKANATTVAVGG